MSLLSLRLANATRLVPPGPEATDGFSSSVGPEVRRRRSPFTFQVCGEIAIRHRFVLSPERAEKISESPSGCHAGATSSHEYPYRGPPSFCLRVTSNAPVLMAGPWPGDVTHQSTLSSAGSFSS